MKTQFNFNSFYNKYSQLYPHNSLPNKSFLEWLIGFTEGDGCFSIAKRGDLAYVITQSTSDVQVLYHIMKSLGFGSVIEQSKTQKTHRYIVHSLKETILLCELFNGNLVLPTNNAKFQNFLACVNFKLVKKNLSIISPIIDTKLPTLNDRWLTGFTDAEGCFTASLLSNGSAFRIRYILTQKWEVNKKILFHILSLLSKPSNQIKLIGAIVPHSIENVYELRINGVKNCEYIFKYFDDFQLITKKKLSYDNWKSIHARLKNKDHLDNKKRVEMMDIIKRIN